MILLAIDPGSHKCGVAIFRDGALYRLQTLSVQNHLPLNRRYSIAQQLIEWVNLADAVICEEPFLQGKANTGMQRLLGMIEFITNLNVQMIHPMTIKSMIAKGSREKIDLALAAGARLKTDEEREMMATAIYREAFDETDAVAIGLCFYELLKKEKI